MSSEATAETLLYANDPLNVSTDVFKNALMCDFLCSGTIKVMMLLLHWNMELGLT